MPLTVLSLGEISPEMLYLDLMKRVLSDSIFIDHPLAHLVPYQIKVGTPWIKRQFLWMISRLPARDRITMAESNDSFTHEERVLAIANGTFWPARAHTMIGHKRLNNLQTCVESVLRHSVPGDLIETGVWRGGACIFMRAILKAYGDETRSVWVADSFEGLPSPSPNKYKADEGDQWHTFDILAIPLEEV